MDLGFGHPVKIDIQRTIIPSGGVRRPHLKTCQSFVIRRKRLYLFSINHPVVSVLPRNFLQAFRTFCNQFAVPVGSECTKLPSCPPSPLRKGFQNSSCWDGGPTYEERRKSRPVPNIGKERDLSMLYISSTRIVESRTAIPPRG